MIAERRSATAYLEEAYHWRSLPWRAPQERQTMQMRTEKKQSEEQSSYGIDLAPSKLRFQKQVGSFCVRFETA